MKIDSHQHFWRYHAKTHAWIETSMEIIKKDFLPVDLAPVLQESAIDGCVAVQAQQSENETRFLLDLAEKNTFIKGVVGWLDLCADTLDEKLSDYAQNPKLKGLRHIVQDEPDDRFMLRPDFTRGISMLHQYGLTYDILIYPKQLSSALELVTLFPEQPFVLDHIAKPKINGHVESSWANSISELGKNENVYCKISGMVTETEWGKWAKKDFVPYLDVVFASFDTNRIMFGSDWPVCLLSGDYGAVVEIVEEYLRKLPQGDYNKIMGDNAVKFYGLDQ